MFVELDVVEFCVGVFEKKSQGVSFGGDGSRGRRRDVIFDEALELLGIDIWLKIVGWD